MRALFAIVVFACCFAALAETDAQKKARLELEQQLGTMVNIPAPVAHVQFMGLDERPYELSDVEFLLDGKPLRKPLLSKLSEFGAISIHRGEVSHGQHVLLATVAYTDTSSMMFSETAGYTWRVTTKVTFTAQRGLETRILLTPSRDSSKERKEQFRLSSQVTPVMLAAVDDGMVAAKAKAAAVEAPVEVAAPVVDAGSAAVAAVEPEVKPVAAEEKAETVAETKVAVFRPAPVQFPSGETKKAVAEEVLSAPPMVAAEGVEIPIVEGPVVAPVPAAASVASEGSSFGWAWLGAGLPLALLGFFVVARRRANRFKDSAP